ncbi:uncharacterized protein KY384_005183 [Bacidia gigantensis]|uniref:uncharacterized protein n=1 Tax=Bacidia gigantensis TaxID=2732470 RepID=UPI001D04F9E4|nr:uncharacterized protein KY384_005183 [Bacidia gigantensis]KAG8529702.1 hypothetical protein KY384_005183 [Bacidia gigantensis]
MGKFQHYRATYNVAHPDGQGSTPESRGGWLVPKYHVIDKCVRRADSDFFKSQQRSGHASYDSTRPDGNSSGLQQDSGPLSQGSTHPESNVLFPQQNSGERSCDDVRNGYDNKTAPCSGSAQLWGSYSPYFRTGSDDALKAPQGCQITFVQYLSRHGARSPATDPPDDPNKPYYPNQKTGHYRDFITNLQSKIRNQHLQEPYAFLQKYTFNLGANSLTNFGKNELVNAGKQFYDQYSQLAKDNDPFARASDMDRVIDSARKFGSGFYEAKHNSNKADPYPIINIREGSKFQNPLNPKTCPKFSHKAGKKYQIKFGEKSILANTTVKRLNQGFPDANLETRDVINLMDLCSFDTVASDTGTGSKFCLLFTNPAEWEAYNYYHTLKKYYGYGYGNPLGPAQGIGFVNEVIARLNSNPTVSDRTSVNHAIDDNNPEQFPIGRKLYADFTHNDPMTSISAALGLFDKTPPLSLSGITDIDKDAGFTAARVVPFAARFAIEKMTCQQGEMIRVLVNERVMPLDSFEGCGLNKDGLCAKVAFMTHLSKQSTQLQADWIKLC